ncbi:MAG: SDR family oxidoreductase [Candidatus Competibacteraceae bacterium]|jgi:thioester reductase-like protein|nr:SDR family oxidoreductase [Candidatus Competibacteraceae bacterium]
MNTYFFTGFPGFIATALIRKMIREDYPIAEINLLVLPDMLDKAQAEVAKITAGENIPADKLRIIQGDITKPNLALESGEDARLKEAVTHVFHLAAVYDLAVPEHIAQTVNVTGTGLVNEWLLTLKNLQRYVYFSTAYVSGKREGPILETELEMGQSFKNHYERTKYEAEVLVRQIVDRIPTTIIRPGIVVGDSKTGETIKFDGPYFILNLFEHLKFMPFIPYFGPGKAEANFVPVDYIFDATLYLGHAEAGVGKTYHLTDPKPHTVREIYRALMEESLGRKPVGTLPVAAAKVSLAVPPARKWLQVELESLDYFTCLSSYDCSQAQQDLEGSGVACPDFKSYLPTLVAYYQQHKHDKDKQLVIH